MKLLHIVEHPETSVRITLSFQTANVSNVAESILIILYTQPECLHESPRCLLYVQVVHMAAVYTPGTSGTTPVFPFLLSLLPQSGVDSFYGLVSLIFNVYIFFSATRKYIFPQFGEIFEHLLWNHNDPH